MERDLKEVIAVFAVVASFGAGYFISQYQTKDDVERGKKFSALESIDEVIGKNNCFNRDNEKKAIDSAIAAYYEELGDEYFAYVSNNRENTAKNVINNSDMAIDNGFKVEPNSDGSMTITVEDGSYARKQGLVTGDVIVQIDNENLIDNGFIESSGAILGESGTKMEIFLLRGDKLVQVSYTRKFEEIDPEDSYELIDDICLIDYNAFDTLSGTVFTKAFDEYNDKADGYIIDLRENLGGSTDVSLNLLGNFIGRQELLHKHHYDGEVEVDSSRNEKIFGKPVVILVNENTASAAEIFTAAMKQYYEDVTLVGTKTYGKGIFQYAESVGEGGRIRYTAGYYTVGDWECYQDIGITPDVEVEMDSELIGTDDDVQLEAAFEVLK